jgi:menaquinone-9 beta-reductase
MTVGRGGYAGLARTADDRITIAAAVDPAQLKTLSASEVVGRILNESGIWPGIEPLVSAADWRGTAPLTRSPRRVAVDNVLVLGDAAGYVEPFTGDGMAAALHSALAVEQLVTQHLAATRLEIKTHGAIEAEIDRLGSEWITVHGAIVRSARRRCRFLAALIRRPAAARLALRMISAWPALANPFLRGRAAGERTF